MKKSLRILIISFLVIVSCPSAIIYSYQENLSFDSLFSMTWYQKGLESSLCIWQTLVKFFDKDNDHVLLSGDLLLGRLAFVQFCINRMDQERNFCVAGDRAYFVKVLNNVQSLLDVIDITSIHHDFVLCAEDMIRAMQKQLSLAK